MTEYTLVSAFVVGITLLAGALVGDAVIGALAGVQEALAGGLVTK